MDKKEAMKIFLDNKDKVRDYNKNDISFNIAMGIMNEHDIDTIYALCQEKYFERFPDTKKDKDGGVAAFDYIWNRSRMVINTFNVFVGYGDSRFIEYYINGFIDDKIKCEQYYSLNKGDTPDII